MNISKQASKEKDRNRIRKDNPEDIDYVRKQNIVYEYLHRRLVHIARKYDYT